MTGNWSSTVPDLGCTRVSQSEPRASGALTRTCTHVTTASFRSSRWIICLLHGGCSWGQHSPLWIRVTRLMSTIFMVIKRAMHASLANPPRRFHALLYVFKQDRACTCIGWIPAMSNQNNNGYDHQMVQNFIRRMQPASNGLPPATYLRQQMRLQQAGGAPPVQPQALPPPQAPQQNWNPMNMLMPFMQMLCNPGQGMPFPPAEAAPPPPVMQEQYVSTYKPTDPTVPLSMLQDRDMLMTAEEQRVYEDAEVKFTNQGKNRAESKRLAFEEVVEFRQQKDEMVEILEEAAAPAKKQKKRQRRSPSPVPADEPEEVPDDADQRRAAKNAKREMKEFCTVFNAINANNFHDKGLLNLMFNKAQKFVTSNSTGAKISAVKTKEIKESHAKFPGFTAWALTIGWGDTGVDNFTVPADDEVKKKYRRFIRRSSDIPAEIRDLIDLSKFY